MLVAMQHISDNHSTSSRYIPKHRAKKASGPVMESILGNLSQFYTLQALQGPFEGMR